MQVPSFSFAPTYPRSLNSGRSYFNVSSVFLIENADMWIDRFNNSGMTSYLPRLHC